MTKCFLDLPAYEWKVAPYSTLWRVALVKCDSIFLYSLCFLRMKGPWVVNFQINTVWVHHRIQYKSWIFLSNPAQAQGLLQVHVVWLKVWKFCQLRACYRFMLPDSKGLEILSVFYTVNIRFPRSR
jgi:hypothetical protein